MVGKGRARRDSTEFKSHKVRGVGIWLHREPPPWQVSELGKLAGVHNAGAWRKKATDRVVNLQVWKKRDDIGNNKLGNKLACVNLDIIIIGGGA